MIDCGRIFDEGELGWLKHILGARMFRKKEKGKQKINFMIMSNNINFHWIFFCGQQHGKRLCEFECHIGAIFIIFFIA